MPKKTYYKPNRSHPRHFTEKDVARIARYVVKNGGHPVKTLAAVAKALGVAATICKAARAFQTFLKIKFWLKKLAVVLATGELIKILIQTLLKAKLVTPPGYNVIIAILIVALSFIDTLIDAIMEWVGNVEMLDDVTSLIEGMCEHIHELGGEVIDEAKDIDAVEKMLDIVRGQLSQSAYEFKNELDKQWYLSIDTSAWDEFINALKVL